MHRGAGAPSPTGPAHALGLLHTQPLAGLGLLPPKASLCPRDEKESCPRPWIPCRHPKAIAGPAAASPRSVPDPAGRGRGDRLGLKNSGTLARLAPGHPMTNRQTHSPPCRVKASPPNPFPLTGPWPGLTCRTASLRLEGKNGEGLQASPPWNPPMEPPSPGPSGGPSSPGPGSPCLCRVGG